MLEHERLFRLGETDSREKNEKKESQNAPRMSGHFSPPGRGPFPGMRFMMDDISF
jgi:hypothetical protein